MVAPSKIVELAFNLASTAPLVNTHRVAAVVYDKKGTVFGIGRASYKTHPLQAKLGRHPYLHAEMAAMIDAMRELRQRSLDGYKIYVARLTKGGNKGLAKPCKACAGAIDMFGLEAAWSV